MNCSYYFCMYSVPCQVFIVNHFPVPLLVFGIYECNYFILNCVQVCPVFLRWVSWLMSLFSWFASLGEHPRMKVHHLLTLLWSDNVWTHWVSRSSPSELPLTIDYSHVTAGQRQTRHTCITVSNGLQWSASWPIDIWIMAWDFKKSGCFLACSILSALEGFHERRIQGLCLHACQWYIHILELEHFEICGCLWVLWTAARDRCLHAPFGLIRHQSVHLLLFLPRPQDMVQNKDGKRQPTLAMVLLYWCVLCCRSSPSLTWTLFRYMTVVVSYAFLSDWVYLQDIPTLEETGDEGLLSGGPSMLRELRDLLRKLVSSLSNIDVPFVTTTNIWSNVLFKTPEPYGIDYNVLYGWKNR